MEDRSKQQEMHYGLEQASEAENHDFVHGTICTFMLYASNVYLLNLLSPNLCFLSFHRPCMLGS